MSMNLFSRCCKVGWVKGVLGLTKRCIRCGKICGVEMDENWDVVDRIMSREYPRGKALLKLYAVVMLNYREPLGDKAWDAIEKYVFREDGELRMGFAYLSGFLMGIGGHASRDKFSQFIEGE